MRIGELARRAGVSVRSLRYYEEQGLVPADRSPGGQREYPEAAVGRVRFIQQLYAAGLASRTIARLLPFLDTRVVTPTMRQDLEDERARLQEQIAGLTVARQRLDELRTVADEAAGRQVVCEDDGALSMVG
ncbi:MAG TPA: MerR family transcriptional regulator [Cellulomonas sp.]